MLHVHDPDAFTRSLNIIWFVGDTNGDEHGSRVQFGLRSLPGEHDGGRANADVQRASADPQPARSSMLHVPGGGLRPAPASVRVLRA